MRLSAKKTFTRGVSFSALPLRLFVCFYISSLERTRTDFSPGRISSSMHTTTHTQQHIVIYEVFVFSGLERGRVFFFFLKGGRGITNNRVKGKKRKRSEIL